MTETQGNCRIYSDEYDVNQDAGSEDNSEDMVSTALRVTGTVAGSGTIRGEEYDVNDIAGSKKDSE